MPISKARFPPSRFEGSLQKVFRRRVLRRRLVRALAGTVVLRRVHRGGGCHRRRLEGA